MVRLEMPEFLVQQDERQMTVMVTNDTGADRDVHVSLQAKGVDLIGDLNQTVRVSTDRATALTYNLKTGDPGPATLTAKAWIDGGPSDGVEQSFPVLAHGTPVRMAWSDQFTEAKDTTIDIKPSFDKTTGRVAVTVSGGLAGNLVSSLDGLIGFPYGCVEQTMSRFMPSVLVAKTVRDLGLPQPKLEKQIPKIAADSVLRLARMQHEDGGWGWWENDASDLFMTALVLDGLDRSCKRAGYDVKRVDTDKAVKWVLSRTGTISWEETTSRSQSYIIYALAPIRTLRDCREALQRPSDKGHESGRQSDPGSCAERDGAESQGRERSHVGSLESTMVHQGPVGAYWDGSDWDWGSESTALGLTAFMSARPDDPLIPKLVRHLMMHRTGDMWDSTRDTAYALIGLTQYLAHTHELAADFAMSRCL